ncbi:MBL fold metallo-hydrolase [Methanosarcina sp.]|uniref:MBL fold metallo-hydrolase n=1 Tax=Methanosarcina sp. TaxID=2213 RepID=UPI003C7849D0
MWKLKNRFIALIVTFFVVVAGFGIGSAVAFGPSDDNSVSENFTSDDTIVEDTSVEDTTADDISDQTSEDEEVIDEEEEEVTEEEEEVCTPEETEEEVCTPEVTEEVCTPEVTEEEKVCTPEVTEEEVTEEEVTEEEVTEEEVTEEEVTEEEEEVCTPEETEEEKVCTPEVTEGEECTPEVIDEEETSAEDICEDTEEVSEDEEATEEEVVCQAPTEEATEEKVVCQAPAEETTEEEEVCETPAEDINCVETSPQVVDPCVKVNNSAGKANIPTVDDPKENVLGNIIERVLAGLNGDDSSEETLEQTTVQNSSAPAGQNLTVHFLDVGQGDSILIECNNSTMLIDAGESDHGEIISDYLQGQGISTLDYVVATHPHSDHIGGMNDVLNNFQVEHFTDSGYPHTIQAYENMLTSIDQKDIPFEVAQAGQTIDFDPAVDIEVLNPGTTYSDDLNENSVVLKIDYGNTSFLLMGDAGLETEEKIMEAGYDVDSDILKVGHHASTSGSGEAFISTVSPEVSIVEVGAGNDYGHPDAEILERLQKASKVYRTDLDGTIIVTTDGSTYTITTQKSNTPYVSPNPTSTETNEVIPTETSTSEPVKTQATTSDTTDTSGASNYENSKFTSTTTSNTINANSGSIIGNSNTNVYHNAGCRYVPTIKPEHLTYFDSRKEAEAADYRACKVCGG